MLADYVTTYEGSMLTYAYYVRTKCKMRKAFPTNMSAMFQADPVFFVASFSKTPSAKDRSENFQELIHFFRCERWWVQIVTLIYSLDQ